MFGNTYVLKPNVEKVQFWKNQVCLVSLFENASKFSHFCLGSFSLVSTNFSILSSLSGRIRPHLALETQNFRNIDKKNMKNLHSKCEKCNFYRNFWPRQKCFFFIFCNTGLDLGLLWTESKAKLKNSSIQKRKSRHKIHQNFIKFNENLMRRAFNSNSYLFPSALKEA